VGREQELLCRRRVLTSEFERMIQLSELHFHYRKCRGIQDQLRNRPVDSEPQKIENHSKIVSVARLTTDFHKGFAQ